MKLLLAALDFHLPHHFLMDPSLKIFSSTYRFLTPPFRTTSWTILTWFDSPTYHSPSLVLRDISWTRETRYNHERKSDDYCQTKAPASGIHLLFPQSLIYVSNSKENIGLSTIEHQSGTVLKQKSNPKDLDQRHWGNVCWVVVSIYMWMYEVLEERRVWEFKNLHLDTERISHKGVQVQEVRYKTRGKI